MPLFKLFDRLFGPKKEDKPPVDRWGHHDLGEKVRDALEEKRAAKRREKKDGRVRVHAR